MSDIFWRDHFNLKTETHFIPACTMLMDINTAQCFHRKPVGRFKFGGGFSRWMLLSCCFYCMKCNPKEGIVWKLDGFAREHAVFETTVWWMKLLECFTWWHVPYCVTSQPDVKAQLQKNLWTHRLCETKKRTQNCSLVSGAWVRTLTSSSHKNDDSQKRPLIQTPSSDPATGETHFSEPLLRSISYARGERHHQRYLPKQILRAGLL